MFRGLLFIFVVILIGLVYPIQLDWLLGVEAQEEEDALFDFLIQIEIQKLKSRILNELGLTEDSLHSDSPSPSNRPDLSPEAIKMLFSEYEPEVPIEQNDNVPKLIILPENGEFRCEWSDEPSCRRFEYNLPPKAVISSSDFWFRKLQSSPGDNLTISVLCSDSEEILINKTDQMFSVQEAETKWEIFQPSALKEFTAQKKEVSCEIETSGITIDDNKQNLPFLKMNEESVQLQRKYRNIDNTGRQNTCQLVPFNFSFEAMRLGDHIVAPLWYTGNICIGYCPQNQYANLMDMYFQHHPELEERYGRCWATCCRPTEYRNMMMIYLDENSTRVLGNMTNAIATRCGCC